MKFKTYLLLLENASRTKAIQEIANQYLKQISNFVLELQKKNRFFVYGEYEVGESPSMFFHFHDKTSMYGMNMGIFPHNMSKFKSSDKEVTDVFNEMQIPVSIVANNDSSKSGAFKSRPNDPRYRGEIEVYVDQQYMSNSKINKKYKNSKPLTANDVQHFLKKKRNVLVHELTHAFDNYISKGKYSPTDHSASDDGSYESYVAYLKLPHEVNARFLQAMSKLDLKSHTDFESALATFKSDFGGYFKMTPKVQKRIISRFADEWNNK